MKPFENIVGKGENAGYQQCFLPNHRQIIILARSNLLSASTFNLVQSKILSFGKELTLSQTSPGFYVSAVHVF